MKNSKIEWTDHTFNPWIGCTKVSPGCANCYAEERDKRFAGGIHWGKGAPRQRTSAANWREPLKWNREAYRFVTCTKCGWRGDAHDSKRTSRIGISDVMHCPNCDECGSMIRGDNIRPRVFCASLADWLDEEVSIEWFSDLMMLVHDCANLDWLLLTKRPEKWFDRIDNAIIHLKRCPLPKDLDFGQAETAVWLENWRAGHAPANVWIGTTVENQECADKRREALRAIPARVHYVSHEPSLEVVNWTGWEFADWFISGGESGRKARPSHPAAHRAVRDFCVKHRKAYLFKQWGEWMHVATPRMDYEGERRLLHVDGRCRSASYSDVFNSAGLFCGFEKHGKKIAGRLLDGVEHNQFPEV